MAKKKENGGLSDNRLGGYDNIPSEEYHKIFFFSNSAAKAITKGGLARCKWSYDNPQPSTSDQIYWTMIHDALTRPAWFADYFEKKYAVIEGDGRNKDVKDARTKAEAEGKTVLKDGKQIANIKQIQDVCNKHKVAHQLFKDGYSEYTIMWIDKESGCPCKARMDYFIPSKKLIVDIKNFNNLSKEYSMRKYLADNYCHTQAAHYIDAAKTIGIEVEHFIFVFVDSKNEPFKIVTREIGEASIERGQRILQPLKTKFKKALETGNWEERLPEDLLIIEVPDHEWSDDSYEDFE